ncbi:MAG: hypothetical protein ACLRMZ_25260 [Blautia marasmi]
MLVQGSWAIAQINGNNPDFESKCGVFQFPGIDGANDPNRMIVKTDNLLMSSTTEHRRSHRSYEDVHRRDSSEIHSRNRRQVPYHQRP